MAMFSVPIKDHKHSILRSVTLGIVRDLSKFFNIGYSGSAKKDFLKDLPILYLDEEGTRKEFGTATDSQEREGIYTGAPSRINIQVSEEEVEGSAYQYPEYSPEFLPVFRDDIIRCEVRPYFSHTVLKIDITYNAQSKAEAKMWQNNLKNKLRRMADVFPHNLQYHYIVDKRIIYTLGEMWNLIKNRNPDFMPFSDYLQKHFTNRFGLITDSAGINKEFAISENQTQVLGYFDFPETIEQGDKVDGSNSWITTVSYLVRYHRPTALTINYPLIVYNQIVPDSLLVSDKNGLIDDKYVSSEFPHENVFHTVSGHNLHHFSSLTQADHFIQSSGVIIPHWNEFAPEQLYSIEGTQRFLDQLILFTEEDFTNMENLDGIWLKDKIPLFNLKQLPPEDVEIREDIIDFIIKEKDYLFYDGRSIFQLLLYKNNKAISRDSLSIDEEGTVYLTRPLSPEGTYNVRIAIYYDWNLLDADAVKRLIKAKLLEDVKCYLSLGIPSNNWTRQNHGRYDEGPHIGTGLLITVGTSYTVNYRSRDLFNEDVEHARNNKQWP